MIGIVTIAVGEKSLKENKLCVESIKKHLPDIPIMTIYENQIMLSVKPKDKRGFSDMQLSRLAKTDLINQIPTNWQYCIYLDSDTRLLSPDILKIIDILKSGYDLCIVPSQSQDFWHIGDLEKENTFLELGYHPLQLQCGVFGFAVNDKTRELFKCVSNTYMLYLNQDQLAFIRALHEVPVKYWLMGYPFNSGNGSVIQHLFGRTR